MLFTGCRYVSPPPINKKTEKKGTRSSFLFLPFSKLIYNFMVCVRVGRGHSSLPQENNGWILFPFSCAHTPLRLWSLSPGAQQFSDLRAARLGIRAGICSPPSGRPVLRESESRVEWAPAVSPSPPHVAGAQARVGEVLCSLLGGIGWVVGGRGTGALCSGGWRMAPTPSIIWQPLALRLTRPLRPETECSISSKPSPPTSPSPLAQLLSEPRSGSGSWGVWNKPLETERCTSIGHSSNTGST